MEMDGVRKWQCLPCKTWLKRFRANIYARKKQVRASVRLPKLSFVKTR